MVNLEQTSAREQQIIKNFGTNFCTDSIGVKKKFANNMSSSHAAFAQGDPIVYIVERLKKMIQDNNIPGVACENQLYSYIINLWKLYFPDQQKETLSIREKLDAFDTFYAVPDDVTVKYINQRKFPPDDVMLQLLTTWARTGLVFEMSITDTMLLGRQINTFCLRRLNMNCTEDYQIVALGKIWFAALSAANPTNASSNTTFTQNITQSPRSLVIIAPTIPPNYEPFINIDFNGRKDDHFYHRKIVELKIMTERFPNVDNKGRKTYRPTNCHVTFYYGATSLIAFAVANNHLQTPLRDVLSGRQATYKYPLTTDPDLKRKMIIFLKTKVFCTINQLTFKHTEKTA
jgi:hypothetical protein